MKKILYILLFISCGLNAQQLAFPSAKGAGAYAVGGRGGEVVHVTNLNDSGVGSLRWAMTDPSFDNVDRTIVFDVSGVIKLETKILKSFNYDSNGNNGAPNITIAGFTAPRGGITIIGKPFRGFWFGDLIIRGIKARNGYEIDDGDSSLTALGFSVGSNRNHIRDHCSYSFSSKQALGLNVGDSALGFGGTNQNSLTYKAGQGAIIGTSATGGTPSIGSGYYIRKEQTWFRNVAVDCGWRHPNVHGITSADLINNINFNWNKHISSFGMSDYNAGEIQKINLMNSLYIGIDQTLTAGSDNDVAFKLSGFNGGIPQFHISDLTFRHATPITGNTIFTGGFSSIARLSSWDPNDSATNIYLFDERSAGAMTTTVTNDVIDSNPQWFQFAQHSLLGNLQQSDILSSSQLKDELLPTVGAVYYTDDNGEIQFERDIIDQWAINRVTSEENTFDDLPNGETSKQVAESLMLGGSRELPHNTRPGNFYGVNQHIPTAWLTRNGYADTIDIHNQVEPDGYTVLEHYINQIDYVDAVNAPIITRTDTNPTSIVQGGTYTPPTGTWTDVEDGTGTATVGGDTVDVNTPNVYDVTLFHTDTDGNTGSIIIQYTVTSSLVNVTSVNVTPSTQNLIVSQTATLQKEILPINSTDQTGVWSSSNNNIVAVSQNGEITGLREGSSTIAFTSNDGAFTDTCVVTVSLPVLIQGRGIISKKAKTILINN